MTLWQQTAQSILSAALFLCLLRLSYVDLTQRRLPNRLVAVVAILGLVRTPLIQGLLGALLAAGPALLVALVYRVLRGQEGMGAGDIKLLGALGLFFGPVAFWILPIASCVSVVGLLVRRTRTIAFGPYLAIGATIVLMAAPK